MRAMRLLVLLLFASCATASLWSQDIASFEKRITLKKLPNGLTIMIMERPEAPVFSFFTYVRVGSTQDPEGQAGLAHMFEHMAFKGTDKIGTSNYTAEKPLLDKIDAAYKAWDYERRKETGKDPKKVEALEKEFNDLVEQAQKFVHPNEFGEIVERNGGVDLNAFTNNDETAYHYSFPSNDLELWAYLESERFLHPVFREFYKERDVVVEERRMRTDSSPIGRLIEQLQSAAYMAHPYRRSTIGFMSEISNVNRADAEPLYKKF